MARPLRIQYSGAFYRVTSRGNERKAIFRSNRDRERKRSGHLFQGRYKAILVEKDSYCQELSRYIHLNPIRAGLADRPSEYRWSSYRCYIGKEKKPAWLKTESVFGYFGDDDSSAQDNYRKFVDGSSRSETKNPLKEIGTYYGMRGMSEHNEVPHYITSSA